MPEKGFEYIIDVADSLVNKYRIHNFKIIAIGGFGGFIREYQKEIQRRELTSSFEFVGFTKNVYTDLKHLDLVLMPSLGEACGLVAMEALVAGTPVIAFSCIGLIEVLRETPARMVAVGDCARLIDNVISVMKDYPGVKAEFDRFIPEARRRFDSRRAATELDQVFENLIRANRAIRQ
jgi:glycosyltransferase involved in cell wall biosynthesis